MAATIPTNGLGLASGLAITDGDLTFASGHGISFAADAHGGGMASELFDDYEEGSYTPTVQTSVNTAGTSTAVGNYIKVGRACYASGYIICNNATSFDGTASRTLRIGLPFTSVNTTNLYQGGWTFGYYTQVTLDSGYYGLVGYTVPNEALIRIIQQANAGVFSLKEGKMNNDDFAVMFGGWYEIA
jgi:hypothetical protein|tara:strand:- start:342 stop:899 length:558 start_codon:yes stop_codon:yes gene_type:complete